MNFIEELKIAKKLVDEENYLSEMILQHLADRKVYHSITVTIISSLFSFDSELSRELVYNNEYYLAFKFETNPFNEEFLNDDIENE